MYLNVFAREHKPSSMGGVGSVRWCIVLLDIFSSHPPLDYNKYQVAYILHYIYPVMHCIALCIDAL